MVGQHSQLVAVVFEQFAESRRIAFASPADKFDK
jgi:hypothetical protein